ncbi:MAG: hemolysin III family protein [Deltaproteobacteria bacterium]|nr:hemolysin III family protein [Deltaproteobacteria bacterium]
MSLNKEPWSAATHFVGFVAAVVGLVFLVVSSAHSAPKVTSMALYGGSLVALFGASTLYHFFDLGHRGNRWLKRLDHSAIFLLIAGSYMPPIIHLLDGPMRITMLAVVGAIALVGVAVKLLWIDAPTWLGLSLYLALGWVVLVPIWWMLPRIAAGSLALLVTGGVVYTAGAVVYAKRWPDPWPDLFGHHEVWHLFVLGGAALHFGFVFSLLGAPVPAF